MKKITLLIIYILTLSCTSKSQKTKEIDIYDQLISLKNKTKSEIISLLGNAQEIKKNSKGEEVLTYQTPPNYFDIFLNSEEKVQSVALSHWKKGFDNYLFLKKRFSAYTWQEKELPPFKGHVVNEPRQVRIPELGIEFEYDNQDPERRPLLIWFFR